MVCGCGAGHPGAQSAPGKAVVGGQGSIMGGLQGVVSGFYKLGVVLAPGWGGWALNNSTKQNKLTTTQKIYTHIQKPHTTIKTNKNRKKTKTRKQKQNKQGNKQKTGKN